ncbi:unnamed protein product [marine sediment metagenome]|uniref:Aldehyde oxidase/xanthine dehydrogenase a/b hammerhead domain-containing protein n=1 Tax=marine sediment metagenome TaxID=412755 RepID=X1BDA5_9ZZZZ
MTNQFSVLGKSVVRKDAIEKVKGEARYIPDIQLPGMLHAKFLRSPHAHAKIKSIDTSKAEALPGVKCILTYQNVPKVHPLRKLEYLLDETMHHPGEEVAAVAALTAEIAEEALRLIQFLYRNSTGSISIFSAASSISLSMPYIASGSPKPFIGP